MGISQYHYYAPTHDDLSARVFGASQESQSRIRVSPKEILPSNPAALLLIERNILHIPPFVIKKWGQRYISPGALDIDLRQLPLTRYKIIAMHDFRAEDRNPELDECLAGIFLAQRIDQRWEEAEDHPLECRGVQVLGFVESTTQAILPP